MLAHGGRNAGKGVFEVQKTIVQAIWHHSFSTTHELETQGGQATQAKLLEHHPVASKYLSLVAARKLQHDMNQWSIVVRLSSLYDQLAQFAQHVAAHRQDVAAFKSRFDARLAELHDAHPLTIQEARPSQPGAEEESLSHRVGSYLPAWMLPTSMKEKKQARQLTPMQQEHLHRARLREQVVKELGHPPKPPSPPRGLYLHGSVGSGKTLLMDTFYSALAQNSQLLGITKHRRVHFNTAMLEIHKLLHNQDMQHRQVAQRHASQQQQQQQEANNEKASSSSSLCDSFRGNEEQASSSSSSSSSSSVVEELGSDDESYESGRMRRSFGLEEDAAVQQQKTSKKAVMAIRKYLSLSRMGRISPEAIASANSRCVALAAAGLLASDEDMQRLEARVLCFDEMQVADVFSAVALKGIVEWITNCGGVMVLTSNRSPEELPRHGLHEGMFSHFVAALGQTCEVVALNSSIDYRVHMLQQGRRHSEQLRWESQQQPQRQQADASSQAGAAASNHSAAVEPAGIDEHPMGWVYASPLGQTTEQHLSNIWDTITQGATTSPEVVPILFGRTLTVNKAAQGAAYFHFPELCAAATGPADFTALAQQYHTLFIHGVPAMSMQIRDQARRFITLVDELYNNKVLLVISSEVPPHKLFTATSINGAAEDPILDLEQLQFEGAVEGSKLRTDLMRDGGVAPVAATPAAVRDAKVLLGGMEEQFAFARALSRLYEMQSQAYITNWKETTLKNWQEKQAAQAGP